MVDINLIKKLRNETGVSIALCKKALDESKGDIKKAKDLLNQWGVDKVKDKTERITKQGGIFSYVHHNLKVAGFIELLCETDFVSSNTEFQKLGKEISMQVASVPPKNVEELLEQEYIRDTSKKIKDLLNEAVLKFGENIKVGKLLRWQLGE